MNKKELTEADIRTKFITPAILGSDGSKWSLMTQLREEVYFTRGRVIVRGKTVKRGEATSQSRHSLALSGHPPHGKLLIPFKRRDVRVVEGARLEIESGCAC